MTDDITYRLNVNSVSQVYSVFLPAFILYAIFPFLSISKRKISYLSFMPYNLLLHPAICLTYLPEIKSFISS